MPERTKAGILRLGILAAALSFLSAGSDGRSTTAGENLYDVRNIPPVLLENAHAVVRTRTIRFEIRDQGRAVRTFQSAVTILTPDARDLGKLVLRYDRFSEIDDLEGVLYDARGEEIRDLDDDDIEDYSAIKGYSLYEDTRVRLASLYHNEYPYTVEYSYEIVYNCPLTWPGWVAQQTLEPVEETRFEVVVPEDEKIRFWCSQDSVQPQIMKRGSKTVYLWEARGLPRLLEDAVNENTEDITTLVWVAPTTFELEGHEGSMSSWEEFGRWYYGLTEGKQGLPDGVPEKIRALLSPDDDVQTRIRKLYRYMQSHTRYVSVQLGIGGWEPFDATYVHERQYGDCKALANYMAALLNVAEIRSYPVLIRSGDYRYPFIEEFPSNQFNHVILCVPLEADSIWLECTSQTIPFGHIGSDNENRLALMITPDGGSVVRTPASSSRENAQLRVATVLLEPSGSAMVATTVRVTGDQQDYFRGSLARATPKEREQWILRSLQLVTPNLRKFEVEGIDSYDPEIRLSLNVHVQRLASSSGSRLFFMPNILERRTYVPGSVARRLSPVQFSYPYFDRDSIFYRIPSDFTIEAVPQETRLSSSFGSFFSQTDVLGDTALIFLREFEIRQPTIPADHYEEYRAFIADVVKADRAQVVLARKRR